MERIELELDTQTIERARRLAQTRHCTVEQLLREMIGNLGATAIEEDVFLGMFAEEPEVIDQVLEIVRDNVSNLNGTKAAYVLVEKGWRGIRAESMWPAPFRAAATSVRSLLPSLIKRGVCVPGCSCWTWA